MSFSVYILFSAKLSRFYTGTTDDVLRRLDQHNAANYRGSFTAKGIPWELFLSIDDLGSEQAYKIEQHIKSMKSKKYINDLKHYPEMIQKLKERFA
ncbi:MAG: GIY-YIG nuclease family protein [Bacteroidota bacterium]